MRNVVWTFSIPTHFSFLILRLEIFINCESFMIYNKKANIKTKSYCLRVYLCCWNTWKWIQKLLDSICFSLLVLLFVCNYISWVAKDVMCLLHLFLLLQLLWRSLLEIAWNNIVLQRTKTLKSIAPVTKGRKFMANNNISIHNE